MGRTVADVELAGPTPTWIKIQEQYLRNEESQPHTRPLSPGFQYQEGKSQNFWLQNPAGIESGEKLMESKAVPLKEHTHRLTYSDTLSLSFSTG